MKKLVTGSTRTFSSEPPVSLIKNNRFSCITRLKIDHQLENHRKNYFQTEPHWEIFCCTTSYHYNSKRGLGHVTSHHRISWISFLPFDWEIRKRICKTVRLNSRLFLANYACACKTAVLKDSFQILLRVSQSNGKNPNPNTEMISLR